jgi:putative CocE/NonD family hydrolase
MAGSREASYEERAVRRLLRVAAVGAALLIIALTVAGSARHELFRRAAGLPDFTHAGPVESVVKLPMRDGVRLHTEVYLPESPARVPVVLVRNPYEYLTPLERLQCQLLTRYGYGCVLQDVRGQLESEGEWYPIVNERHDGLDTLAWLVKQPFVDGNIGMRGTSYLACVQWAIADALPPEVKTLVPAMFGTDLRLMFYERGQFRPDILTAWAALMPGRGMRHGAGNDYLAAARYRPAIEADERVLGQRIDWYRDALGAADPDAPYWHTEAMTLFRGIPERVQVPMLLLGAFFDPFFEGQRDSWGRLASREQSVFVIGPWNHLGLTSGDVDLGASPGRLDQWPLYLEWFDHHLKGKPLRTLKPGQVRTWGVGDTSWAEHDEWPRAVPRTRLSLAGAEHAASCEGGTLQPEPGPPGATVQYTFDPANPVPTRGGAALLSFAFFRTLGFSPGPVDQADSCTRPDVVTFRGAPGSKAQRLSGAARLELQVSSTAPDTAFVARLIAEQQGKAVLVREAVATLSWPADVPVTPPMPGTPATLRFDFWPIEWVLPAGGRWRLDVTSSSFPALTVHANRVGPWQLLDGADVAQQTLHLDDAVLELPLTSVEPR